MPIDLDMSKYPRPTNRARQAPTSADLQPGNKMSNDDNSPNETKAETAPKTDIKASFRRSVEERGKTVIAEYQQFPCVDVFVGCRPGDLPATGAHKMYIEALRAYIEQNLGVTLEVREHRDRDGDIITSFSIAVSSLI